MRRVRRLGEWLQNAFSAERRTRPWLLLVFVLVNGAALVNAVGHDPRVGYDAGQHLRYVDVLASGRLPLRAETAAYYGPPLPYVVPALVRYVAGVGLVSAARAALLFQWALSIILTVALLGACQRIRPEDGWFKVVALVLCGSAAVYYRTFAMIRGEPYLATGAILLVVATLGADERVGMSVRRACAIAVLCSVIALSRQLGALLLVGWATFAVIQVVQRVPGWGRGLVLVGATVVLTSGWFYLGLRAREGTPMAWNLPRASFSLANQPLEFYFGTGSGALFARPGRPRFQKQLLPVLHADWWGDYWHYFLFKGRRSTGACVAWPAPRRANTMPTGNEDFVGNYDAMLRYLGVVNSLALLPVATVLGGLVVGGRALLATVVRSDATPRTRGNSLVFAMVASTVVGYLWFVISYPRPEDGDTVKATYVFQLAPLVAMLAAEATATVRSWSPRAFRAFAAGLVIVAVAASPTWISRWRAPVDCVLPSYAR